MQLIGRVFRGFVKLIWSLLNSLTKFLMSMFGIASEADFLSNELRKALVLLFISFVVFFVFFSLTVAILLVPSPVVVVPDVVGKDILDAIARLEDSNLIPSIEFAISQETPKGHVLRQIPSPGNMVREGKTVKLFVSIGSGEFVLPDFSGKHLEEVRSFLSTRGIYISSVEYVQSEYEANRVIRTLPPAGTKLKYGDNVVVYVSIGSEVIAIMPNMVGFTYDNAMLLLDSKKINFKVTPTPTTNPANDGIVLDQIPKEGEPITEDSTPELIVGVFGDDNTSQTTKFILYKLNLSHLTKDEFKTYYVNLEIKDQKGTRNIKKVLSRQGYLVIPLKVNGIANIKVYVNDELVKEDIL